LAANCGRFLIKKSAPGALKMKKSFTNFKQIAFFRKPLIFMNKNFFV